MIIIWILIAILMFCLIVIIHELWHFLAARFFGVKVEEFWIWIPPFAKKLFTDKKGTTFTLNWLPLWWFVRLKWENNIDLKKDDNESFSNKSYFAKTIILLWGVFMNFLLAWIIFSVLFFVWVKPIWINSQIQTDLDIKIIPNMQQALESWLLEKKQWIVLYPIKNSIAEKSWIKKWDILLKINNKKVESPEKLIKFIWKNSWKEISIRLSKECFCPKWAICKLCNPYIDIKLIVWENWKIWSYLSDNLVINKDFEYKYWVIDSIKYWFLETYNQSLLTIKWISILWKNIFNPEKLEDREEAVKNMKWPIWILELVAKAFEIHWLKIVIILSAIISINLGVFNLLPIPALDWWRWLLITISTFLKKIFWEKVNTQFFENYMHVLFFIVLIALSLIIWYNDIINIIKR